MSRTDHHRPYWVKVNDHGVEHHDHSQLGEDVWRDRAVRNEDGTYVYEEATFYRIAQNVLDKEPRSFWAERAHQAKVDVAGNRLYWINGSDILSERPTNHVIREAEIAVAQGDPRRPIRAGTYRKVVYERYLAFTVADHCTIGEKRAVTGYHYNSPQPCYMEADWTGADRNQFRCSCCMCSGRDPHFERARRRNKRDVLRKATKLANSGAEDWEDGFNPLSVTTPLRYNTEWC